MGKWSAALTSFTGTTRRIAASGAYNGKVYVGTGFNGVGGETTMFEYNPSADTWTQKADYVGARWATQYCCNGQYFYIHGGDPDRPVMGLKLLRYDMLNNSYSDMADRTVGAGLAVGGGANGNDGNLYFQLGTDFGVTNVNYQYNIAGNSWASLAVAPAAGQPEMSGFGYGGGIFILKGYVGAITPTFYRYDIGLNTWSTKADYGGGNIAFGFLTGDGTYIYAGVGGSDLGANFYTKRFYRYDPVANDWGGALEDYPGTAINECQGIYESVTNAIYVGVGNTAGGLTADWYKYDLSTVKPWYVYAQQ